MHRRRLPFGLARQAGWIRLSVALAIVASATVSVMIVVWLIGL